MKITNLTPALLKPWLASRRPDVHKNDVGHVLVVAGSRGMLGAARLCASGALRGGAGLVTLATPASLELTAAASGPWECITLPLPDADGALLPAAVDTVAALARTKRYTAIALGPGLSVTAGTVAFVRRLLDHTNIPVVLDADGLNALARAGWPRHRPPLVLTPHPGEAGKLLGRTPADVQKDRTAAARSLAERAGGVCVLKGAGTLVTDESSILKNPTGHPGMAAGGMGDVLTGLIAALIGQMAPPDNARRAVDGPTRAMLLRAAAVAVYVHGLAGELASEGKAQLSLTAGDLVDALPLAFRKVFGPGR
jgi:NAD(P)H-hydrate epimerase